MQVRWNEEELELGGPLQRAVLAILLLNVGRVASREQLIDRLWETDPPPRAAQMDTFRGTSRDVHSAEDRMSPAAPETA